jgi:hypothetical protein
MSPAEVFVTICLLGAIVWVLGSLAATAWGDFRPSARCIIKLGTAGWFHGASSLVYGQSDACITKAWPVGTQLRVYNAAGVFVDVVVVPEPLPFLASERVLLHLARPAFLKLAPLAVTHLHVQVEILEAALERESQHVEARG